MLSEPRTYRYSTIRLVLLIFLLILLGVAPMLILGTDNIRFQYVLYGFAFIGLSILVSIFTLTRSTTISNDGISTRGLLGEASLNWNEIHSVSGSGNGIKLHNRDGDVTVAPSAHLPGYPEVIEIIGVKRPDLFDPAKYGVLARGWLKSLLSLSWGAILLGVGIYLYLQSDETMMPVFFLAVIALGFLVSIFLSVLSLKLDGSTLTIRYLLNKIILKREDVHSMALNVMQTRAGKSYNAVIFTKQNRMIRFSGIGPSLPIAYLVLKNWHQGQSG